jgi:macrodomain Ter protein organizer (MatP/YcbG family)
MARSRFTITQQDTAAALAYISNKLRDPYWPSEDTTRQLKAEREYETAKREPVTINEWCEKWLNSAQWTQLKNAIRAARKRTADLSRNPPKSITLSHTAWQIISDLARRDEVTLSALIENRLGREWGNL